MINIFDLTGITTPGQSGLGSNGNERVFHIPQISRTEAHHYQIQFSVISRTLLGEGVLLFCTDAVSVFSSPQLTGLRITKIKKTQQKQRKDHWYT